MSGAGMDRRSLLGLGAGLGAGLGGLGTGLGTGLSTALGAALSAGSLLMGPSVARAQGARPRAEPVTPSGLDWQTLGAIYEVNIRQHSAAGTLRAVQDDLSRIRSLGVGIVWLMPLQPIGELRRKGSLGSYYSIRDYTAVNPEFGTLEDVKSLVRTAHGLGLKVILDWVANHTAWDHPWITGHPDWYRTGADGQIQAVKANPDDPSDPEHWEDVAWLDYGKPEMAVAMIEAMRWWRTEVGLDGFRCDVAGFVPTRFWEVARQVLERDGPLIMLAEADKPEMHATGFDISYDWRLQERLAQIAQGRSDAQALLDWWVDRVRRYPAGSIGMNFLTNHDINSWHGSDLEIYGSPKAAQAMAVLAATLPGIPLLYSGQETFHARRLAFFERDPIDWSRRPMEAFFTQLLKSRAAQPAFSSPLMLDGLEWLPDDNRRVITYRRVAPNGRRAQVSVNLSDQPQTAIGKVRLPPWGWQIGAPVAPAPRRAAATTAAKRTPTKRKAPATPAGKQGAAPASTPKSPAKSGPAGAR